MGLCPTTTFTALDAYCHEGCPPCQSNNAALWCGGDMGVVDWGGHGRGREETSGDDMGAVGVAWEDDMGVVGDSAGRRHGSGWR